MLVTGAASPVLLSGAMNPNPRLTWKRVTVPFCLAERLRRASGMGGGRGLCTFSVAAGAAAADIRRDTAR